MKVFYALPVALIGLFATSFYPQTRLNNINRLAQAAWPQETICSGSPVPDGWVIIDYTAGSKCGSKQSVYSLTIANVTDAVVGATIEVCPQHLPAGWVVTEYKDHPEGCCSTKGTASQTIIIKCIATSTK